MFAAGAGLAVRTGMGLTGVFSGVLVGVACPPVDTGLNGDRRPEDISGGFLSDAIPGNPTGIMRDAVGDVRGFGGSLSHGPSSGLPCGSPGPKLCRGRLGEVVPFPVGMGDAVPWDATFM